MAENTREEIIKHNNPEYIASRPDWVVGKVPDLCDYRKISVENMGEAFKLAQLGQTMADIVVPGTKLYFTQAVLVGAAVIDRSTADKLGLDFDKYRSVLMVTPTRFGKGYAYSTPVLTLTGWKKHGDLRPGDVIFRPSGGPTVVVACSTPFDCAYTVTLENGEIFKTSAEHEWYVYDRTMKKTHRENGKKIVDSYGGYRIMETQELAENNLSDFLVDTHRQLPTHHQKLTRIVPHQRIGITKIEKVEKGEEGNCIQVDSPDGLYLVGETLITTHNSFLNAFIAISHAALGGKEVRIGGATTAKAGIIQEKIVSLLPKTSQEIQEGLVITSTEGDANKKIQRLATQASKEALAWKSGGTIKLFSTNETRKNTDVAAAGAVGVGGDTVILDELQLMTPMGFRTASRFFLESNDTKRFCVGNPQINGHFRDLYDDPNTFVVHINDSGAIIEQRLTQQQIDLTGIPTYSAEYRAFCVDGNTEALTNKGWVKMRDLPEDAIIAQIEDGKLSFVPIEKKIELMSDKIIRCRFNHREFLMTPEHRQLVHKISRRTKREWDEMVEVRNLKKNQYHYIPSGGVNIMPEHISVEDRLEVVLQADGHIAKTYSDGQKYWVIGLKKERKIQRLLQLLNEAKWHYTRTTKKNGVTVFRLKTTAKFSKVLSEYFGWEIGSPRNREIWEEMLFWDGNVHDKNYFSTDKQDVDFAQALLAQSGFDFGVVTHPKKGNPLTTKDCYVVHQKRHNLSTLEYLEKDIIPWGNKVYCVTVPSGVWLARRNNKIINTGNCQVEFPPDNAGNRFFSTLPAVFDEGKFPIPMSATFFMGIDSAYKGADSLMVTVVGLFQGGGQTWVRVVKQEDMKARHVVWDDATTTYQISFEILKIIEKYNIDNICIDIGFGVHLYETLVKLAPEKNIDPVNFASGPTEFRKETDFNAKWALNLRAEMHLDTKELCESNMLYIDEPYFDTLIRQMREVGNTPEGQKIKIESKKDIKMRLGGSPDALDSLCLAIRAMVISGILRKDEAVNYDEMIYVEA